METEKTKYIVPEPVEAKKEEPTTEKKFKLNLKTMKVEEVEDGQQANNSAN